MSGKALARALTRPWVAWLLIASTWLVGAYACGFETTSYKAGDLFIYRAGGAAVVHDPASLYSMRLLGDWQFTYPPFAALLFAPFGALPVGAFRLVIVLMFTVSFVAALRCGVLLGRAFSEGLARRGISACDEGRRLLTGAVTVALVLSFPVLVTFAQGQINVVLLWLVLEDLLGRGRRPRGLLTGLAMGIKLTPGIFLLMFLLTRRWREAAWTAGGFLLTVLIGLAALPSQSRQFWLSLIFDTTRPGDTAMARNQSLKGVVWRALGGSTGVWLVLVVLTLAAAGFVVWRLRRRDDWLAQIGVTALAGLLVSPVSWDHHWVWTVPLLLAMILACLDAVRRPRLLACGVVLGLMLYVVQSLQVIVWEPPTGLSYSGALVRLYFLIVSNATALVALGILTWWVWMVAAENDNPSRLKAEK